MKPRSIIWSATAIIVLSCLVVFLYVLHLSRARAIDIQQYTASSQLLRQIGQTIVAVYNGLFVFDPVSQTWKKMRGTPVLSIPQEIDVSGNAVFYHDYSEGYIKKAAIWSPQLPQLVTQCEAFTCLIAMSRYNYKVAYTADAEGTTTRGLFVYDPNTSIRTPLNISEVESMAWGWGEERLFVGTDGAIWEVDSATAAKRLVARQNGPSY